jgi:menaquinone-dependent protoporphyrinogen IX oxidase
VVYDPGLTGAPKNIADKVASDLQSRGYQVELAGIKSSAATTDIVQYQIIVVGGPVYGGNAAASVKSYLSNLKTAADANIGVFGVGSFSSSNDKIAPLPNGSSLTIKETLKISTTQNPAEESAQFVTKLLS